MESSYEWEISFHVKMEKITFVVRFLIRDSDEYIIFHIFQTNMCSAGEIVSELWCSFVFFNFIS